MANGPATRMPGVPPHQPPLGDGRERLIDELAERSFPGPDLPARGGPSVAPATPPSEEGSRPPEQLRRDFIRGLPEGEGAGPGAPETAEPVQGRPGAGGHGPSGPGGPAMLGLGRDWPRDEEARRQRQDRPDLAGALAFLCRAALWGAVSVSQALRRPGRRGHVEGP